MRAIHVGLAVLRLPCILTRGAALQNESSTVRRSQAPRTGAQLAVWSRAWLAVAVFAFCAPSAGAAGAGQLPGPGGGAGIRGGPRARAPGIFFSAGSTAGAGGRTLGAPA